jgi:Winged helix-turn helix/DDE superfamily endonuclease
VARAAHAVCRACREELQAALAGPAPDGTKHWTCQTVADWMAEQLGRPVPVQRGWEYLQRLKQSRQAPRPRHALANPEQQDTFKKLRPLLQAVATAFPQAHVELRATDEQRIGLKPLLRRVCAPIGQRPIAPVQHRFAWCYLIGFVHPASGRTYFHLATTVSIPVFEVELAEFARQVGASARKQIVLALDRAAWHTSPSTRPTTLRLDRQRQPPSGEQRRIWLSPCDERLGFTLKRPE